MAQVLSGFSFELIVDPDGAATMTVLMVPHMTGIRGKITVGDISELVRYLEDTQDKMRAKNKEKEKQL